MIKENILISLETSLTELFSEREKFFLKLFSLIFLGLILLTQMDNSLTISEKLGKETEETMFPLEEEDDLAEADSFDDSIIQIVSESSTRFSDVEGNQEAKKELQEIVKFLKEPENFSKVGANVPKGVLLGGPPGTGKTLLAKALAGEAGTSFLSVSGSQFVELFVGLGASRVRQLFAKARSIKPTIIYIDEIDSIAKRRSTNTTTGASNDEREQTLNQILTEMDGFKVDTGVVVIASTNRLQVLDPAIKRPGRFDRQIVLTNPNLAERQAILGVHAKNKKLDVSVSLLEIAQRTPGFSGADLANLLNEAAILAVREKKTVITMKELDRCVEKILFGLEKNKAIRFKSKLLSAFHEIGHAFLGFLLNQKENLQKVTIRGSEGGKPLANSSLSQYQSRKFLTNQIFLAISGRAAEENIAGVSDYTVGAQVDLDQISRYIRVMILRYAMYRLQEFKQENQERNLYLLGSDARQEINNMVDNFTTNFIDLTYHEVSSFLEIIRPGAERLVDELVIQEELSGDELRLLVKEYLAELRLYISDIPDKNLESVLFRLSDFTKTK